LKRRRCPRIVIAPTGVAATEQSFREMVASCYECQLNLGRRRRRRWDRIPGGGNGQNCGTRAAPHANAAFVKRPPTPPAKAATHEATHS
jgi:hypothetical protein